MSSPAWCSHVAQGLLGRHLVVGDGKGVLCWRKGMHLHRAGSVGRRGLDSAVHLTARRGCRAGAVWVRVSLAVEDFLHGRFSSMVNGAVLWERRNSVNASAAQDFAINQNTQVHKLTATRIRVSH